MEKINEGDLKERFYKSRIRDPGFKVCSTAADESQKKRGFNEIRETSGNKSRNSRNR